MRTGWKCGFGGRSSVWSAPTCWRFCSRHGRIRSELACARGRQRRQVAALQTLARLRNIRVSADARSERQCAKHIPLPGGDGVWVGCFHRGAGSAEDGLCSLKAWAGFMPCAPLCVSGFGSDLALDDTQLSVAIDVEKEIIAGDDTLNDGAKNVRAEEAEFLAVDHGMDALLEGLEGA